MKWFFTETGGETGPGSSSSVATLDRRSPQHAHLQGKVEQQVRKPSDKEQDNLGTLQKKKFTAVLQKTLQAGAQKSNIA